MTWSKPEANHSMFKTKETGKTQKRQIRRGTLTPTPENAGGDDRAVNEEEDVIKV